MFDPKLGVTRMDRTVIVTPCGRLIIIDECRAEQPRQWSWLLHSDWRAEAWDEHAASSAVPHESSVIIRNGPGQAWVTRLAATPTDRIFTTTQVQANPTGSTPSLMITRTLHTTQWRTQPVASASFRTVLETTSAITPQRSELLDITGDEYDFGDEWVAVGARGSLDGRRVRGRAKAAVFANERLAVIAATDIQLIDRSLHWDQPFTGVIDP